MKRTAALLLGGAMVLSLAACGQDAQPSASPTGSQTPQVTPSESAQAEQQKFTPGTYTAEAEGIRSTVKLAVTFSEDAITDIEILEQGESRNIADAALEQIPAEILDKQSLAVDVVSSVTFTSRAIINAVTDACEQAGGNMDLLKAPIEATPQDEEVTADVVVVGMGLAGVTASMSALDQGATVVAVEKAGAAGGSSKYSGGFITGVGTEQQQAVGYDLDVDGYMDYFNSCTDQSVKTDETDRDAVRAMIERSAGDIKFLEEHGIGITGPDGFGGDFLVWHYPATRTSAFDGDAGGADHIVAGMDYLDAQENFSIYYNTPATSILTDDSGAITGVLCERDDGSTLTVNAKSVVLSCGGWAASPELMERFCPDFPSEWILPYTTAAMTDTGDGITMAEALGAAVYEDGWWMDLAIGVDPGGYTTYFPDTLNGLINYANYFVVDGEGTRVFNVNALYGPRSIAFADAMERTGKIFSIFTAEGFENGIAFIEENGRVDDKNIYKADTLEELAEKTGMDVENFTAQVARYNEMCANGVDEDMGQTTLIPIGEGPYYAVSVKTITMGTIGGLKTNDDNQVLSTDGTPIEGLYGAGELINGKYFNQVYVSGCAQLLCSDSGIVAGAAAADYALGN
ncbi:FAD binding domain protein [Pseudoflavonifractor capillosus ATCC 29799]|uniref:Urocanate reductase n=1 Tax=Pseudoflavonifractor capillosus ATCC 29799 TaxID=411467 RepID=A6NW16_9FIRM|nr:FAD-dependent oxidoreductase [Pseudoflavonifractor capillosus]EDM99672.1 FAD binding domain protein [Pseudoflavonifractor capillosus ATCC 29799]